MLCQALFVRLWFVPFMKSASSGGKQGPTILLHFQWSSNGWGKQRGLWRYRLKSMLSCGCHVLTISFNSGLLSQQVKCCRRIDSGPPSLRSVFDSDLYQVLGKRTSIHAWVQVLRLESHVLEVVQFSWFWHKLYLKKRHRNINMTVFCQSKGLPTLYASSDNSQQQMGA